MEYKSPWSARDASYSVLSPVTSHAAAGPVSGHSCAARWMAPCHLPTGPTTPWQQSNDSVGKLATTAPNPFREEVLALFSHRADKVLIIMGLTRWRHPPARDASARLWPGFSGGGPC